MKKILLTRHAKSCWLDNTLSDHDRPLNNRGVKSAAVFSKVMSKEFAKVEAVYVSSAKRAQQTALGLKLERQRTFIEPSLYTFNVSDLSAFISSLYTDAQYIQLIGHNPAFTDFVNAFSMVTLDNIPTCGMVVLQWDDAKTWQDLFNSKARLLLFDAPKRYR